MVENNVVDELEDVEVEDDFFEKVLNDEIKVDDKEESGASDQKVEKVDDRTNKDDNEDGETVESLKAKIAELERERKGQLSDVVKSRRERQQFKSELSQLKSAVSSLLEQRKSVINDDDDEEDDDPLKETRTKVEFSESGDEAFVNLDEVKKAIEKSTSATKQELDELKQERMMEDARNAFKANVESVISTNKEVFTEAYKNLSEVYKDLNDAVIEMQNRTGNMGNNGVLTQDQALEALEGTPEEKEFLEKYPGMDLTRIARAFNSKVDLRVGLKHIADVNKIGVKEEETLDEKIKAAKEKPGGLGAQGNRNSEETGDLIQRIASLSNNDFENLSDNEVAKIEAMLLREETK